MTLILGDESDRNQEGLFDKVEQLDLNIDQATVLFIAINQYYQVLRENETIFKDAITTGNHEGITKEELEGDLNMCQFQITKILQVKPELETLIKSLDSQESKVIQSPKW